MVQSASRLGQATSKARRRSGAGTLFMLMILAVGLGVLLFVGFLAPTKLVTPQEQLLGLLHGGIATIDDAVKVECVAQDQDGVRQATTSTERTITFRDATVLTIIFNTAPAPTTLNCATPKS